METETTGARISPGLHDSVITVDGVKRTFRYYIPAAWSAENPATLTLVLHGMNQTGKDVVGTILSGVGADADKINNVIAFPTALFGHWNDGMGGIYPATDTINDVKFLASLIDFFNQEFNCTRDRNYVIGFSNGGLMTYRLSCEIPGRLKAIAPFLSMMGKEASQQSADSIPVPIFITNGTADPIMRWNGGKVGTVAVPVIGDLLSNDENISYWLKRNLPYPAPILTHTADYCPGDLSTVESNHYVGLNEVIFNKVINGGHYVPIRCDTLEIPTYNGDFESVKAAWLFLHRH